MNQNINFNDMSHFCFIMINVDIVADNSCCEDHKDFI